MTDHDPVQDSQEEEEEKDIGLCYVTPDGGTTLFGPFETGKDAETYIGHKRVQHTRGQVVDRLTLEVISVADVKRLRELAEAEALRDS